MLNRSLFILFLFSLICFLGCRSEEKSAEPVYKSEIQIDSLFSDTLNRYVKYRTYVPDSTFLNESTQVIYLLHGHGGSDDDWITAEEGNVQQLLDSLVLTNQIPPVFAATLNAGNSWYVNQQEAMESMYIKEFIPYIESHYNLTVPEGSRVLAGNSAGGYGALRFGLLYPSLFKDVMLLSPAAYYPSPPQVSSSRKIDVFKENDKFNDSIWQSYSYQQIAKQRPLSNLPTFYISTGDDDKYGIFEVISQLNTFFTENEIKHEIIVTNGGHSWDVWRQNFCNDLIRILNQTN